MNNPIQIHRQLREIYLKYINSGIPLFHDKYIREREALLQEEETICQPPIIEVVPQYRQTHTLREFCSREEVSMQINDFIQCGLFESGTPHERKLYQHQYNALKYAFRERKNIIVTTGTGSGKTECFLLPLIADLVSESATWPPKGRTRAMRGLILYPLNALAEDQMVRLRKALNSRATSSPATDDTPQPIGARDWLDHHRHGNRFYFGRYTGATPLSSKRDNPIFYETRKKYHEEWESACMEARQTGNTDLLYHLPCMDNDSGEQWHRWDMQDHAPDILITNYSMLNIMLMRDLEAPIFEQTRQWLQEDPNHTFHLIIDELHTYRGTAGTEVAYLIRVLLDRLGLTPESPQVQYLASSASMQENEQTRDYLCSFFGVTPEHFADRFRILANEPQQAPACPDIPLPAEALLAYIDSDRTDEQKQNHLLANSNCTSLKDWITHYQADQWLLYALSENGKITATKSTRIAQRLPLNLPREQKEKVIEALLHIICKARKDNTAYMPLRAHYFFRNLNGLWACTDPGCTAVHPDYQWEERKIGKMYKRPRNICECGKQVLELIICQSCGEVYLGGYKAHSDTTHKTYLRNEPTTDQADEKLCILRKHSRMEANKHWKKVDYQSETGEFTISPDGKDHLYDVSTDETALTQFPAQCPQCEVEYRVTDHNSFTPLVRHTTGVQKVN